jgi:hypothetical protein
MSIDKLKTVFTTGAWLTKVKTFYDKINEIIDYLNGTGSVGSGSYKKYVATLNQTGANAPTATILENTLGNLVWSYDSVGWYYGTLTGVFTSGRTVVLLSRQFFIRETGGVVITYEVISDRYNNDSIFVGTAAYDGISSGNVAANAVLVNTGIEIRVYN